MTESTKVPHENVFIFIVLMEMGERGCIQCTKYEMRTAHLVEQDNADTELINQKQDLSTRGDQDDTDITPPMSSANHMDTHSEPLPLFIGAF